MVKCKKVKLSDIATVITGSTPKTSVAENYSSNDLNFFKPSDIVDGSIRCLYSSENFISNYARSQCRIIPPNSVLVTCIGIIGKIGVTVRESACNQQINAVVPNKELCSANFLAYAISNAKREMNHIANAAVVPIINKSQFSNIQIFLPPLPQQQQIAAELDLVCGVMQKQKQQYKLFDQLIKYKFNQMFGNPITNDKGWEMKQIGEVVDFIDYRGKTPEKTNKGIPLITAKNVKDNSFSLEPREFVSADTYDTRMTRGYPRVNDVLFTTEAPLGNVCRIPNIFEKFCVGQRIITMQGKQDVLVPEYLERELLTDRFQSDMWKHSSGSTVKGIRSKELVKLFINVPPLALQQQFADFVAQVEKSKIKLKTQISQTETLYKALMQKYFGNGGAAA